MPRKRDIEGKRYQVMAGTSTRRSARRHSPGFEQWIHYRPGDIVTDWPEHAPCGRMGGVRSLEGG